jgi:protein O-GlcNAc transferase
MAEGDRRAAIERFRRYLRPVSGDFRARTTLAILLALDGRASAARRELAAAAAASRPERALVYTEFANALVDTSERDEAIRAYESAVELQPDHGQMRLNLASALALNKMSMAAAYHTARAVAADTGVLASEDPSYIENLLLALLATREDPETHRRHAERLAALRRHSSVLMAPRQATAKPLLRVGYVSPDFRHHAVASFFAPVLAAHDRERFRTYLYGEVRTPDSVTERLQGMADSWVTSCDLTAEALAERIRGDGIDVLVDLAGLTGGSRLDAFALRPAPVQLTWIGYPATTGLTTQTGLDGRIADAWTDPPGLTEGHFSERLFRLPSGFTVYRPLDEAPPVAPAPAGGSDTVTFGSFNNAAKISDATIALWTRAVNGISKARLLLKSYAFADRVIVREIRARFAAAGLAANRLDLQPAVAGYNDHLSAYREIDIALDTFPYNGTTTTCEALWMGVPVLTLRGSTHASRVGHSLLSRLGLADWIAETDDIFVAKAAALSQDRPMLTALRSRLRPMMMEAPLFDPSATARELEALYQQLAHAGAA